MTLAYSPTTATTDLNRAWRKMQGSMVKGFQTMTEEWDMLDELPKSDLQASAREFTRPIDLNSAAGAALISEGGHEANPSTPNMVDATFAWSHYNQRWTTTLTARYLATKDASTQLVNQLRYQAMKAIESLSKSVGEDFYGFSTGVKCQTTTAATQASGTYTLANAYGVSALGDALYLAQFFSVNDRVALVRAGALVANAIGRVTAVSESAGTIAVTWNGSVTSVSGDNIVMANSIENSTLAGTSYDKALTGLLDGIRSASVHGITTAAQARWAAALDNTAGGRYSGIKLRKARQALYNRGGCGLDWVIYSNGVENDTVAGERSLYRSADPMGMEIDGKIKSKGVKFMTSRKALPGFAVHLSREALMALMITPKPTPTVPAWGDGDKLENRSAVVFSIDHLLALHWNKRLGVASYSGLTEQ